MNPDWTLRFWTKVHLPSDDGCWVWTASQNGTGYGALTIAGARKLAHRLAYAHLVGPIPDGLDLDHLCRNRMCVNPAHLEPVTRRENLRRSPLLHC